MEASVVLQRTRGALGLVGPLVDTIAARALESTRSLTKTPLPSLAPYHITLLTKSELKTGPTDRVQKIEVDTRHIHYAGVGGSTSSGVLFVVIIWAAGQQIRKRLGLPPKHFHITLTTHDDHDMDKGIDSLFPDQLPSSPAPAFLDHLAYTLHAFGRYQQAQDFGKELVLALPDSHRGFLRVADAALLGCSHKLAMLSYGAAYERSDEDKVRGYCLKKMIECSKATEWGTTILETEIPAIPAEISHLLLTPWTPALRSTLSDSNVTPSLQLESRQSVFIPASDKTKPFYKLPRFFRWLIPYYIAIMSTPRHEEDISVLASPELGIRHILTLTEETPLPPSWFYGKPITNTYLPIPDYHPPSVEQMDLIMTLFEDESKLPLLVHCGGGKGRAGTVAACYMAAFGFGKPRPNQTHPALSASEAVALLRHIRPGSIETAQQEAFVSKWCSVIWKRQSVYPDLPSEPPPSPLVIEGSLSKENDLFVLVGLPGSGKSWFSKSLLARDPSGWTLISQDDSGSRSFCESEIGRAQKGRVLLDRCNTAAADRKMWLDLASNWCKAPACVFFDYDRALCIARAQMRAGHPTLPPGSRVRNAVEQMQKVFVRPTTAEGFKAVVIIRSFAAAEEFVLRLSPPIGIFKFPRTPHLINLGAASSDDIVVDAAVMLSDGKVVITEKVDGANMGFSLSSDRSRIVVQNRSHYVDSSTHEQFKKLGLWVECHHEDLVKVLDRDPFFPERYILFGEWTFATHSISYTHLPDRFLAFDLYDRSTRTWSDRESLSRILSATSISLVPVLHDGEMPSEAELRNMVQLRSKFWDGRVEGIYVKVERDKRVIARGKVVRSDFIAGNVHWSRGTRRVNGLKTPVD
ncbi:putative ATP dependent DNA ligase [Lyophyllum shimeji]|uniref:ATP dependent DNA ligase n=1 Tax=Lyophyllum shimeji TaxID=47721 RepID=A0A9P3UUW4_LYOSH|nr:putative ATP dependent DNA ligase [Lyophyllum shimeji]